MDNGEIYQSCLNIVGETNMTLYRISDNVYISTSPNSTRYVMEVEKRDFTYQWPDIIDGKKMIIDNSSYNYTESTIFSPPDNDDRGDNYPIYELLYMLLGFVVVLKSPGMFKLVRSKYISMRQRGSAVTSTESSV